LKLREWLQYGGRKPFEGLPGFNGLVEGIAPSTAQSRKTQKGLPSPKMMNFKNFRYLTFHKILEIRNVKIKCAVLEGVSNYRGKI
jgi:hypothetical protein